MSSYKNENENNVQINPKILSLVYTIYMCVCVGGGHAVTQLVEALRYKLEGHAFDSRLCHWNFSLT